MKVELRPITSIRPYENNPRISDDKSVDAVAASIKAFGFRVPILLDKSGSIIASHVRYEAALKLGLKQVPVIIAKDLTPEQIKAFRIADNQCASLSDWNYELLPIELSELQNKDYDLNLLGFDPDELARLLDPNLKDGLCDPDEVPAPPDEPTTRVGDLLILGDHRLLCGDSSKTEDVDRLLERQRRRDSSAAKSRRKKISRSA
jgi:ParB-like chromosome segregation protein Spo0J